jgi:hypothetical protein
VSEGAAGNGNPNGFGLLVKRVAEDCTNIISTHQALLESGATPKHNRI